MGARSIWKGSIACLGIINIPAKLYSATENKKVHFHQIHTCGSRITMPKFCPACNRQVEASEIRKGYELTEDRNIILEESDFASLPLKTLKTVEITDFVDPAGIDLRCFDTAYLLTCEGKVGADKAIKLLRDAMATLKVVGIAKLVYREREHLAVVRPYDSVFLLQTLHYADEMRGYEEIAPKDVATSDREREMLTAFIRQNISPAFDLAKYHDEYREALERLIEIKVSGGVMPVASPEQVPSGDIAEQLLRSLELAGVGK